MNKEEPEIKWLKKKSKPTTYEEWCKVFDELKNKFNLTFYYTESLMYKYMPFYLQVKNGSDS